MIHNDEWVGPDGSRVIVRIGVSQPVVEAARRVLQGLSDPANYTVYKGQVRFNSPALTAAYNEARALYESLYSPWSSDQYNAAVTLLAEHHTDWMPFTFAQPGMMPFNCLRTRFLSLPSAYVVQVLGNMTLPVSVRPTPLGREWWVYFSAGDK